MDVLIVYVNGCFKRKQYIINHVPKSFNRPTGYTKLTHQQSVHYTHSVSTFLWSPFLCLKKTFLKVSTIPIYIWSYFKSWFSFSLQQYSDKLLHSFVQALYTVYMYNHTKNNFLKKLMKLRFYQSVTLTVRNPPNTIPEFIWLCGHGPAANPHSNY